MGCWKLRPLYWFRPIFPIKIDILEIFCIPQSLYHYLQNIIARYQFKSADINRCWLIFWTTHLIWGLVLSRRLTRCPNGRYWPLKLNDGWVLNPKIAVVCSSPMAKTSATPKSPYTYNDGVSPFPPQRRLQTWSCGQRGFLRAKWLIVECFPCPSLGGLLPHPRPDSPMAIVDNHAMWSDKNNFSR